MAYRVKLPHVGESVTEAVIGKWLKQAGEHVEKFDPMVEVVTDKVSMEFPAPEAGTLTKVLVDEGATVPMGTVIAEMELDDPSLAPVDEEEEHIGGPAEPEPVDRVGRMVSGANVGPTGGVFADASTRPARPRPPERAEAQPAVARPGEPDLSDRYSPVVVRLAAQRGIDLRTIAGTGLGGRITKQDVLAVAEAKSRGEAVERPPQPAPPADRIIEPSPVRKIIAARMVRSWNEIPHAWTVMEADVSGMVACREAKKAGFLRDHGVELTYLAFTVHATAQALRANPLVNSTWDNGKIKIKGRVNVGVAVAAPQGLVVPVVHDADRQSIAGIAKALGPLVERARNDRLTQEDVREGTFTLNNTGALGSVWGKAIIAYPQAAILNTEAIVKRPVVLSGPGGEAIAIRPIMNFSLSFDHRIIDGSEAAAFLQDVKRRIEAHTLETDLG